ncbi:MAG: carboxypeptidase regulatory-like domain-containing protein [Kofleriaceae bacterium]
MRGVPVVRLAGGPPLEGPRGSSTPERTRVVRGRVIDRAGQPVEGAVVMIDQQFYVMDGNLMAKAGATTDAKGEFVVPNVPVIDRSWARPHAIALHPTGWSAVTAAAGDTLELRIIGRGGLRGKARYGARPESFTLEIYSKLPGERTVRLFEPDIDLAIETFTGRFGVYYETYPDGRYEIASLPPGDYTVRFMLAVNTDGSAPRTFDREVSIVDGQTTILDVDQERAGVVVLDIAIPQPPDIMECWLFEGSVTPTVDTVATLAKRSGVRSRYGTETPVQFYDVAPGIYTACALARNYNREPWFGCSPVFIGSADDVREVELKLVATSM